MVQAGLVRPGKPAVLGGLIGISLPRSLRELWIKSYPRITAELLELRPLAAMHLMHRYNPFSSRPSTHLDELTHTLPSLSPSGSPFFPPVSLIGVALSHLYLSQWLGLYRKASRTSYKRIPMTSSSFLLYERLSQEQRRAV